MKSDTFLGFSGDEYWSLAIPFSLSGSFARWASRFPNNRRSRCRGSRSTNGALCLYPMIYGEFSAITVVNGMKTKSEKFVGGLCISNIL
ncbi:hypothetical protein MKW98_028488 [Papaver atlanticum]|uniref:Uncharacterized protein n=1 Tax=Papaver atlanticum TaxID=357466 RepID=A0AAD4XX70_9MAGN|nr:hypothetical protein MKW98_028488 [Papaver atlanticum]